MSYHPYIQPKGNYYGSDQDRYPQSNTGNYAPFKQEGYMPPNTGYYGPPKQEGYVPPNNGYYPPTKQDNYNAPVQGSGYYPSQNLGQNSGYGYTPQKYDQNYSQSQQRPIGYPKNTQQYDDVLREYNHRTNDNIQNNLSKGAAISELETILDGERRRAKELRSQMEQEFENEKRLRVDFENKMIRLKDESQKREMFVSELEYKLSTVTQENDAVVHENRAIKDELNRLQEMYGHKIRELEDRIAYMKKQQIQLDDRFRVDFDRMKSDYETKIESLNREWELRVRALDEKNKTLNHSKSELEQENRMLQDTVMKVRLDGEEELREAVVRVQDEEMRKYMSQFRAIEQKFKASDEARENLLRKNQDLMRVVSERDRQINELNNDFDQEKNSFKQELSEYHNQLNQAQISRDKLRNELMGNINQKINIKQTQKARDAGFQRTEAELIELQKQSMRERENRKQEIDRIQEENNKEKRILEDIRDQQARKLNDQDRVIKQMEQEIERLRLEHERICSSIQNNINRGISQAISENPASRFENRRPQFGQKYE